MLLTRVSFNDLYVLDVQSLSLTSGDHLYKVVNFMILASFVWIAPYHLFSWHMGVEWVYYDILIVVFLPLGVFIGVKLSTDFCVALNVFLSWMGWMIEFL